jgi:hypothetical protein
MRPLSASLSYDACPGRLIAPRECSPKGPTEFPYAYA